MTQYKPSETSMEDILNSIRKIMSEEGEENSPTHPKQTSEEEPILELTKKVEPVKEDVKKPQPSNEESSDSPKDLLNNKGGRGEEGKLLSSEALSASVSALSTLNQTLDKLPSSSKENKASIQNGVEELVIQILRPFLKEWLDENLPQIVSNVVSKEIKKLVEISKDS